jgi:hypothetical protein
VTEDEAPRGVAILRLLSDIPSLTARAEAVRVAHALPGSRYAADRAIPLGVYPGTLAAMKLAIASDHLGMLHRAILPRPESIVLPPWAHYSLIRGAIEAAADARWLTDRHVSATVRVERGLDRMLHNYAERAAAERAVFGRGKPGPQFVDAVARSEELLLAAAAAGLTRSGHPGTTQLIRDAALCGEGFDEYYFRFLSGVLHGTPWASVSGDRREVRATDEEVSRVKVEADQMSTWYVLRCTLRHYLAAIVSLEEYVARGA